MTEKEHLRSYEWFGKDPKMALECVSDMAPCYRLRQLYAPVSMLSALVLFVLTLNCSVIISFPENQPDLYRCIALQNHSVADQFWKPDPGIQRAILRSRDKQNVYTQGDDRTFGKFLTSGRKIFPELYIFHALQCLDQWMEVVIYGLVQTILNISQFRDLKCGEKRKKLPFSDGRYN